jgi:hypothetical protein
VVGSGSEFIEM